MIQGLVEQLGGEFRLSSTVGVDTTAELLFPATTKEAAAVARVPSGDEENAPWPEHSKRFWKPTRVRRRCVISPTESISS